MRIATSAVLRAGRLLVPEKMTSSISAARIDLCDVSPMTQRSASTRLDLPQPLGPTTPVSPGSIRKSVGSTKDLNPINRKRVSFIAFQFQLLPARGESIPVSGPVHGVENTDRDAASARRMNRRLSDSNLAAGLSPPVFCAKH